MAKWVQNAEMDTRIETLYGGQTNVALVNMYSLPSDKLVTILTWLLCLVQVPSLALQGIHTPETRPIVEIL